MVNISKDNCLLILSDTNCNFCWPIKTATIETINEVVLDSLTYSSACWSPHDSSLLVLSIQASIVVKTTSPDILTLFKFPVSINWPKGIKHIHHLNWIEPDLLLVGCCNENKETTLALFEVKTESQRGRLLVDLQDSVCPVGDEEEVGTIQPMYFTQYLPFW